jgi:Cu2+-exporting ATPase
MSFILLMSCATAVVAFAGGGVSLAHAVKVIVSAAHLIARRTRRLMYQNLAWAVLYNVIAIPHAATDHVTPLIASIGMAISSLVVVLIALRVLRPIPTL